MFSLPETLGLWTLSAPSEAVLVVLGVWTLLTQGAKHGYFYSFEAVSRKEGGEAKLEQKATTPAWYPELHYTDIRMMYVFYLLLVVAGCDLVLVFAVWGVGQLPFQVLIDLGATGEAFTEQPFYYEWLPGGERRRHEKTIYGERRLWLALASFPLMFYVPLLRRFLTTVGLDGVARFLS